LTFKDYDYLFLCEVDGTDNALFEGIFNINESCLLSNFEIESGKI